MAMCFELLIVVCVRVYMCASASVCLCVCARVHACACARACSCVRVSGFVCRRTKRPRICMLRSTAYRRSALAMSAQGQDCPADFVCLCDRAASTAASASMIFNTQFCARSTGRPLGGAGPGAISGQAPNLATQSPTIGPRRRNTNRGGTESGSDSPIGRG
jgi:hypothetical protein